MFKLLFRLFICIIVAGGILTARGEGSAGISGQYWFDFGGERHPFSTGSFEISTDGLDEGFHALHAFVEDKNGISASHTGWFFKQREKIEANSQITCTYYVDGQLFGAERVPVNADGTFGLELDMNAVGLGMHTISIMLANEKGLNLGSRNGIFMRVPSDLQRSTFAAYYYIDGQYAGTIDVGQNSSIVHLDIDATSLTSGIHSITAYMASPYGMATSTNTAWFVKIPAGGAGVKQYSYWLNDNEETLKTVDLPEVSNPYNVMALIDVPMQPFRSKTYTFAIEENAPVLYACNDFKIRFIDPDSRVSTASRTFTDVRVKSVPGEITPLGEEERVSTGEIPSNTVKLYKFDAEIGDSINVRLDRATMLDVYSPSAEHIISANGVDATNNSTFTAGQNGTYYVAVHDIASENSATLDFSHIHRFALLGQNVAHTANRGCFEMNVKGNGFESLQSLFLTGNGAEHSIEQYKVADNYSLCAMIDLDDMKLADGEYRLKGIFKDISGGVTENIVSSASLTVEQPTPVEIEVEIDAPRIAGTPYLSYINVTNRSNVGVWGVPLNIAAKHTEHGGTIDFMDFELVNDEQFKELLPVIFETDNLLGTDASGSFAPAVLPFLGPGETKTFTIGFTTEPHEVVEMYVWAGKPWSEEGADMLSGAIDIPSAEEPYDGNIFSFAEFYKLYAQLEAEGGIDTSSSELNEAQYSPKALGSRSGKTTVRVAYKVARAGVVSNAYSAYSDLVHRIAASQMIVGLAGKNVFAMNNASLRGGNVLYSGQALMAAGFKRYKITFVKKGHETAAEARSTWKHAVPTTPNKPAAKMVDCYQSFDPNDMTGYCSPSGSNYIGIGVKNVTYTIEFENDSEIATAPASTIKVTSRLDGSKFDLSSLKALTLKIGDKETELPAAHHFVKTLDMRSEINAIAELTFDFDSTTGVAEWKLRSLDPLTLEDIKYMDYGILPVNDDSGRGTGYLTFSVGLLPSVADNAKIESKADIVFDSNEPISTPVWTNITDYTIPSARIVSQTTDDNEVFDFTVEGNDSGSGIWFYDLYMRTDSSQKWTAVKTHIENSTFSYISPHVLENATFAVLATDKSGNRQSDASLDVFPGDADGNGSIDANDVVATRNYYLGENKEINVMNADVTEDDVIDTQDATAIINMYLDNAVAKSIKYLIIK